MGPDMPPKYAANAVERAEACSWKISPMPLHRPIIFFKPSHLHWIGPDMLLRNVFNGIERAPEFSKGFAGNIGWERHVTTNIAILSQ